MPTTPPIPSAAVLRCPGLLVAAAFCGLLNAGVAESPGAPGKTKPIPYKPGFHLNLMPQAFVKNPTLEMTVFTELTDYGRTVAPATLETPVYYEGQDSGEQSRGFAIAGDRGPSREELRGVLQRTLAAGGYLPADAGHRPGLVFVYYWGSHNRVDHDLASQFPELAEKYYLERAALVGGKAYARKLADELYYGLADLTVSSKKEFLRTQAREDLYYVVVSAYAHDQLARNERRLVWRTTMTVNTRSVSMRESLPPLIVTAGDYFGRATGEPLALRRTVLRGTVKLGPMYVIESDVAVPVPGAAAK